MPILGLRDTSNFVANQRPENWRQGLLLLYPNSAEAAKAPLTALTSLMKNEVTDDPVYHWWEKSMQTRRLESATALNNTDVAGTVVTLTVTAGAKGFKEGDVFMVEGTNEILQCTEDPTADTAIKLARGAAGSTIAAMNPATAGVNPMLVCIGSAFEEGSLAPTGVQFDPYELFNQTQIFRSTIEATRTALKTRLRTPDAYKEAKRECLEVIGIDMERAFWFGRKHTTTKNGRPLRFTQGVRGLIPAANQLTATNGALDMDTLEEWMFKFFQKGASEKMAFGGNRALHAINQCVRKNTDYHIEFNVMEYGMRVTRITTPFGELVFKSHPLFTQMSGGVNGGTQYYGMESAMFVMDMTNIKYRYLTDSDLDFQKAMQVPGMDGLKEGYLAECGMELPQAETHFYCANMYSGAKDA